MSRYEPVPSDVESIVEEMKTKRFSNLDSAYIMVIFDNKKKVSNGRHVIARIKKMNDELKFFAMNDAGFTYDYAMFIDKNIWMVLDDRDKERIIFHELSHCEVDFEKSNPYGIKDHEIQGFYDEADYNIDDLRWSERIGVIATAVYDPENNEMPEDE